MTVTTIPAKQNTEPFLKELWRKLGDDGLRKAAYRGGC